MIPAHAIYRLVRNTTDHVLRGCPPAERHERQRRLVEYATDHQLDLQDFSTLLRVASGETPEGGRDDDRPEFAERVAAELYHERMQALQAERANITNPEHPTQETTP